MLELPAKINLGSGKDWRADCLNVDVNPYWRPDMVHDLNQPFPFDQSLPTRRFGEVVLRKGQFEEIFAFDVFEHLVGLTTAMNTCLDLLRHGGVLTINVPYDLSHGAWQDPTHVRAFNERSLWYYTDWYWYMGWTEARFDVDYVNFIPSPYGEELKKQGLSIEEILRRPRAVDYMRVKLRKRPLTEQEKEYVRTYLKRPEGFE